MKNEWKIFLIVSEIFFKLCHVFPTILFQTSPKFSPNFYQNVSKISSKIIFTSYFQCLLNFPILLNIFLYNHRIFSLSLLDVSLPVLKIFLEIIRNSVSHISRKLFQENLIVFLALHKNFSIISTKWFQNILRIFIIFMQNLLRDFIENYL